MKSLESIARELGITKQSVNQAMKKGLEKVWCNMGKLYPDVNSFERMQLVGQFCNVTCPDDWPHFFYSFPTAIRKEVIEEAINSPQFKGLNADTFVSRDFKKRNQKPITKEDDDDDEF